MVQPVDNSGIQMNGRVKRFGTEGDGFFAKRLWTRMWLAIIDKMLSDLVSFGHKFKRICGQMCLTRFSELAFTGKNPCRIKLI